VSTGLDPVVREYQIAQSMKCPGAHPAWVSRSMSDSTMVNHGKRMGVYYCAIWLWMPGAQIRMDSHAHKKRWTFAHLSHLGI